MKQNNDSHFSEQVLESTLQAVRKRTERQEAMKRGLAMLILLGVLTSFLVDLNSDPALLQADSGSENPEAGKLSIIQRIEPLPLDEERASAIIQVFSSKESTLQVQRIGDPELRALLAGETYGLYKTQDGQQHLWKKD